MLLSTHKHLTEICFSFEFSKASFLSSNQTYRNKQCSKQNYNPLRPTFIPNLHMDAHSMLIIPAMNLTALVELDLMFLYVPFFQTVEYVFVNTMSYIYVLNKK